MEVVQEAVVLLRQSSVHMSQVVWQLEGEEADARLILWIWHSTAEAWE